MRPLTKRLDPDLARFCVDLAGVAQICAGATNAVLINANAVRLNLGIPRGGTVLVLRFPAAAVRRDEPALHDLLAERQPKPVSSIHAAAESLTESQPTCTTASTGASIPAARGWAAEEEQP